MKPKRKVDAASIEDVRRLAAEGCGLKEITRRLGWTDPSVLKAARMGNIELPKRQAGRPFKDPRVVDSSPQPTAEQQAEIEALIDAGCNTKQIIRKTDYPKSVVLEARRIRREAREQERSAKYATQSLAPPRLPEWDDGRFLAALQVHHPLGGACV